MESIRLINLRSFRDSGDIRLAPLTLLVGQNSSGKSTVARIIPLLKQTAELLTREPILWLGRLVDFGSSEEATSRFSEEEPFGLKYSIQVETASLTRRRRNIYFRTPGAIGETSSVDIEILYKKNDGGKIEYRFSCQFLGHKIDYLISNSNIVQLKVNSTIFSGPAIESMIASTWTACFPNITYKNTESAVLAPEINVFARTLRNFVRANTHGKSGADRVENLTRGLLNSPLDKLLPAMQNAASGDSIWNRATKHWTESTPEYIRTRDLIVAARSVDVLGSISLAFNAMCIQSRYITPVRASAERYYRQQGLAVGEIDSQGQNVAMFLHNLTATEKAKFSEWMARFFGFSVETTSSLGHVSLIIKEDKDDEEEKNALAFNLADTGFGFSQVLPILIQLWMAGENQSPSANSKRAVHIIAIEQPELHLHPRLQAKLTDVLIQAILSARKNGIDLRLVMETHSEQIVNRVGKRVSQGVLDSQDTNVVIFEKSSFSTPTSVFQSQYDADGLLENWPFGFFDSEA